MKPKHEICANFSDDGMSERIVGKLHFSGGKAAVNEKVTRKQLKSREPQDGQLQK